MDNAKSGDGVSLDVPSLKQQLGVLLRHASQSRLAMHTGGLAVEVAAMEAPFRPGRVLAEEMVFILISGDSVRFTLKIHFNIQTARQLALRIFGVKSAQDISAQQARDYVKEYANLVAGSLVAMSGTCGIELGISLPLCTRGFYEVFADYSEKTSPLVVCHDFWVLRVEGQELSCSAQVEMLDLPKLSAIAACDLTDAAEEDEEMMFL
jgi:CheY-specific phosphatase CheX